MKCFSLPNIRPDSNKKTCFYSQSCRFDAKEFAFINKQIYLVIIHSVTYDQKHLEGKKNFSLDDG